jgi:hypothetical protein
MNRMIPAALALACALALGACNASDVSSLAAAAAATAPNLPANANVSQVLTQAGVTPSAQASVTTNISKVQAAATKLCSDYRPLASGILNIGIALSPSVATVANSEVGQGVRGVATIICNGLAATPTYTAFGNRKGELVTAYVRIGRFDRVPVYGIRTR